MVEELARQHGLGREGRGPFKSRVRVVAASIVDGARTIIKGRRGDVPRISGAMARGMRVMRRFTCPAVQGDGDILEEALDSPETRFKLVNLPLAGWSKLRLVSSLPHG